MVTSDVSGPTSGVPTFDDVDEFVEEEWATDFGSGKLAATESFRPALVKLTDDIRDLEAELFEGFDSRRSILEWTQRLAIRTLGEIPQEWFFEMANQFRGVPKDARERVVLSALLTEDARTRELNESSCRELRRQLSAKTIRPAGHRAFRMLRKDATEYVDNTEAGPSKHHAHLQKYPAMRPSLAELERYQQQALTKLLDGFDDRQQILEWGHDLELATHGEIDEEFVTRCYTEVSTRRMLQSTQSAQSVARELFAAHYLIPQFNRGVRDLAGRAKELPDEQREQSRIPKA